MRSLRRGDDRDRRAACWVHARRPFFVLADVAANARSKAQGRTASVVSPLAVEAVRRIDALFAIERSINGQSAERRRQVRHESSAPVNGHRSFRRSGHLKFPCLTRRLRSVISRRIDRRSPLTVAGHVALEPVAD